MLYLLDADTLIKSDRFAYPLDRFPPFWRWLRDQGERGFVKIVPENFEEVRYGPVADWLAEPAVKAAMLLAEDRHRALVDETVRAGYGDLNEAELEEVGRDPFLIAAARLEPASRVIVTFERSRPSAQRANRKIPDVAAHFGVRSCEIYAVVQELDFRIE